MGIDFSHCDAHWSYSGFNRARERLCAVIGLQLREMVGFGGTKYWPEAADQPLVHLLDHSDCEGEMSVEQCKVVAPALRKAVEPWPTDDYDRQHFLLLADGMDAAAAAGKPLSFQ